MALQNPIVWIDCEMTGLRVGEDKIIEVAALITDGDLNIVDDHGFHRILHQPQHMMDGMDEWCRDHHGSSGLTAAVLASDVTASAADDALVEYIRSYVRAPRTAMLGGNSVHVDRAFLLHEFPRTVEHLHYRIIDVSTVKELARRWHPQLVDHLPAKRMTHRALDDIRESIDELRYYRQNWLRQEH